MFQESFDPTVLSLSPYSPVRQTVCTVHCRAEGLSRIRSAFPLFAPTRPDINDGEVKDSLMNVNRDRWGAVDNP